MSGNIFVDCVFLFLICYALVSIFYNLSEFLINRYCKYKNSTVLVLEITSGSQTFEYDIRCAISKSLSYKCALVVIHGELSRDEYSTLWRLTDVYEHIVLTSPDEFMDKLNTAKSISKLSQ